MQGSADNGIHATRAAAANLRRRRMALCKPDKGTKKPTYTGWGTRSLEYDDFGPGDLIGILGGPLSDGGHEGHATVIIDLDAREAVEKADAFLIATGMMEGKPPDKPNDHRYYLVDVNTIPAWAVSHAGQAAAAAQKATGHAGPFIKSFRHRDTKAEVIRFIGTGGQAVCPSPGGPRVWHGGQPGDPAIVTFTELWDAVCRLALACGCRLPDAGPHPPPPRATTPDRDRVRQRAVSYLAKCPPAVSRQGGHNTTMEVARAVVYGFDLGPEVGFQLLWEHYNPRCVPPWSERELRHKCQDADTKPFGKPRGWLLQDRPARTPRAPRAPKPAPKAPAPSGPQTGAQIILAYLKDRYRPLFKRGNAVYCADGEEVTMTVACAVPNSRLVALLCQATDAPQFKGGGVNKLAVAGPFFRTLAKVAWGDLLDELPDEDQAQLGDDAPAGEAFRQMVRDAMVQEVVLGDVIHQTGVTQTEKRSLIEWCVRFAKPGPWRAIRSKRCWCKLVELEGGEVRLRVAVRRELFAQLPCDPRLRAMSNNTFTRRAERYGVGSTSRKDRPHGQSALVLADDFVADLIACAPEADEPLTGGENLAGSEMPNFGAGVCQETEG